MLLNKQNLKGFNNTTGVYLMGQVALNPFTKEEFYCIKVGKTNTSFKDRFRHYITHNPMVWLIDILEENNREETDSLEKLFQDFLERNAVKKLNEWHIVDRNNYLKICDKGFCFFQELIEEEEKIADMIANW